MDRRDFLRTALATGAAALPLGRLARGQQADGPGPNVVLILADDLGYGDVGYHGWDDVRTPNIDALAAEGVQFSDAYVSAPMCSPSRAGLLTGRYQQRWGSDWNYNTTVPPEQPTVGNHLKDAGYATACFGKWHWLNDNVGASAGPHKKGFEQFYGFTWAQVRGGDEPWMLKDGYFTDVYADKGIEFMQESVAQEQPFFLYLSFGAVHVPMHIAPGWEDEFTGVQDDKRRQLLTMLGAMDAAVGRVVKAVDDLGVAENTLIVFLSDNGGYRPNASSNAPLRGAKMSLYEGGIREPMIWRWPGSLPAGKTYSEPVIAMDITASILNACSTSVPENLDGVDILPDLCEGMLEPPDRTLLWRTMEGHRRAARKGKWKWVMPLKGEPDELYDLEADIGEQNNVADEHPEVLAELKKAYQNWEAKNAEPRKGGRGQFRRYMRGGAEGRPWHRPAAQQ
jgi:arylsulfatase A-like enzyme